MRRLVRRRSGVGRSLPVALLLVALMAGGCSSAGGSGTGPPADPATLGPEAAPSEPPSYAEERPGPLTGPLHSADVLISSPHTLPPDLVEGIRRIDGVEAVLPLSVASAAVEGRTLTVAAVDVAEFRRFTLYETAHARVVWNRLARGDVAVDLGVSRRLAEDGTLRLGPADGGRVPVGVYAPLVGRIHAVVNESRGEQLGMPRHNALLVSTGRFTPSALETAFDRVVRGRATAQTLAREFDVDPTQVAVLTGTTVSQAVGTFSYSRRPRGEISPEPAWVQEYIRTEEVPILGEVTCNKAFLPQLRAALEEVVRRGLADEIHPEEYAGCYYPRYIGRDPANGLSLHSWGIAVDLNVPGNQRGTTGEIDRQVVEIFKRWGMDWGGDWSWTDPMHFEMSAVVRPG